MSETLEPRACMNVGPINGLSSLQSQLGILFSEQQRLREHLEQTRADLNRVNAEVLRVQKQFCTDAQREAEYRQCVKQLMGIDPSIEAGEIAAALQDRQSANEFLAELEGVGEGSPEVKRG